MENFVEAVMETAIENSEVAVKAAKKFIESPKSFVIGCGVGIVGTAAGYTGYKVIKNLKAKRNAATEIVVETAEAEVTEEE